MKIHESTEDIVSDGESVCLLMRICELVCLWHNA